MSADLLAHLAVRLESDPRFVAWALAQARERQGWGGAALADALRMDAANLPQLGICRRPIPESFLDDVLRIAERVQCNPEALAGLLLSVQQQTEEN